MQDKSLFKSPANGVETELDLSSMGVISSTDSAASEIVAKLVKVYTEAKERDPARFPYKITTIDTKTISANDIVVLYLQYNGVTVITPILFGGGTIETKLTGNIGETTLRAPTYNMTRLAAPVNANASPSVALTFIVNELLSLKLINTQSTWDLKHLDLAGCIHVNAEDSAIDVMRLISVATTEMRTGLLGLHGASKWVATERDINHLNYTKQTSQIDIGCDKDARDTLGNNIFSPLLIRLSHRVRDALGGGDSGQMAIKTAVHAFMDVRPMEMSETRAWCALNPGKIAPLLVPMVIVTGFTNRQMEGALSPTICLDALIGTWAVAKENLLALIDQCEGYSTAIDTSCTTYDWNFLSTLIGLQSTAMNRPTDCTPRNAAQLITNLRLPTPQQRKVAYDDVFGPLELYIDAPQSGEGAKVRQQLVTNLPYYHQKLTGERTTIANAVGSGSLIPHGTSVRVSSQSVGERDVREVFNTLGMLAKFHIDGSTQFAENFIKGCQHTNGTAVIETTDNTRRYKDRYDWITSALVDDGSFKLKSERVRYRFSNAYMDEALAHANLNGISYVMTNSGQSEIARIKGISLSQESLDISGLY